MLITWDEAKRQKNYRDHGLDFAAARDRFDWSTALVAPGHAGADARKRFKALGMLDGRVVGLVFSLLGTEAIALISLRPANRSERNRYAQV